MIGETKPPLLEVFTTEAISPLSPFDHESEEKRQRGWKGERLVVDIQLLHR